MGPKDLVEKDLSVSAWRKSSHSGGEGGNCVEVALNRSGVVTLRDSKKPGGPILVLTPHEWTTFIQILKRGDGDGQPEAS